MPASIASFTAADDSSAVAFITRIPPNPIFESISPVFPRDLFSIFPGVSLITIDDRSAENKEIAGAAIAVVLIKSLLFITLAYCFNFKNP
jgi:hypothetical protein